MIRKIFTIICFFICFSCSTSKSDKPLLVEKIEPDMEIYQFSDGSFFSYITYMEPFEDYIYVSENNINKIYKVNNTDFSVATTIGKAGRGPGEFQSKGSLDVCNDSLFVVSENAKGFSLFVNDEYKKSLSMQEIDLKMFFKGMETIFLKVQYKNGYIYYCPSTAIETIYRYNINSCEVETFAYTDREDVNGKYGGSIRIDNNRVYFVAKNYPYIKIFDYNGNVTKELDMGLDTMFKTTLDYRIEKETTSPNSLVFLFSDIQVRGYKLYCVTCLRTDKGDLNMQLLVFDTKDEIKLIRRVNFKDQSLLNICVTDKYLWSFSQKYGNVVRFDRKKYDL